MLNRMFPVFLALLTLPAAAGPPAGQLRLVVDTPRVGVTPRAPGRNFVELPTLEYRFVLEPRCTGSTRPASLSLSAADTRQRVELAADDPAARTVETVLQVPATQLAPVPVSGFCEQAQNGDAPPVQSRDKPALPATTLRIDAALSAQLSLLCVGPDTEHRVWFSRPLAVELQCEQAVETGDGEQSGDAGTR